MRTLYYLEPLAAVIGTHALASHARLAASSLDTGGDSPTAAAGAAAAVDGTAAGHSATGHSVAAVGAITGHCSTGAAAAHSAGHTAAAGGAIGAAAIGSACGSAASPRVPVNLSTMLACTQGTVESARPIRSGTAKRATLTSANAEAPTFAEAGKESQDVS